MHQQINARARELASTTAQNLSEIVRVPSLSGDEEAVIARLAELCEQSGLREVRIDGLGNLVVRVGSGPRLLAIDAHIDVVDTGDPTQWDRDPFSGDVDDGKVYGRGSVDQKGGAASMITAARILTELAYGNGAGCDEWSVYFTFTIMEEDCDGLCWNYLIEAEGLVPELAVITEPTNLGIYLGQRGRIEWELYFGGLSAHGSAPERGDNAIYRASETALRIRELHPKLISDPFLGQGSVAVTQIQSDSPSLCAIPDRCMIHLDRRLTWGETEASSRAELEALADSKTTIVLPQYDQASYRGAVHAQPKYFPTWKTAPDHPLVQAGGECYRRLFREEPRLDRWTFSTNGVAIAGKHGIPCIGFGPGNEIYAHAPNESIEIEHLVHASAFYALLPYILQDTI